MYRRFWIYIILLLSAVAIAEEQMLYLQPAAMDFIGVYNLRDNDPNITGQGVTIAAICRSLTYKDGQPMNDFAVNTSHPCFDRAEVSQFSQDPNLAFSPHSSAIASILVGDAQVYNYPYLGSFYYEGICPKTKLDIYEFWFFLKNYIYTGNKPNADILTISNGSTTQDWWTRGIENLTNTGTIIVAGVGNGLNAADPILYPGGSANVIGVGVIDSVTDSNINTVLSNFALPSSNHSSFSTTSATYPKPDIVAPGNCIVADTNDSYRISGNYVSFATPIVAGSAALLKQKINKKFTDNVPKNSTAFFIKSILLTSADKLPYWHKGLPASDDDHTAGLDYLQGAGLLNATAAMELLNSKNWHCSTLDANEIISYAVDTTGSDNDFLTITLTWNYKYQDQYPFNLVYAPNLKLLLWATDINEPTEEKLIDFSNCPAGTVEHIYTRINNNYNNYRIEIIHSADNDLRATDFSVSWQIKHSNFNTVLPYDLNNDGIVNNADSLMLINSLGKLTQSAKGYIYGDLNSNGKIDSADVKHLMNKTGMKALWKK